MRYVFFLIPTILFTFTGCRKAKEVEQYTQKNFRISEGLEIILQNDNGAKILYTKYEEMKSGIMLEYDKYNRISKKSIFFRDTLIHDKEYYWGENKLDSIVFSTYEFKKSDSVFKYPIVVYPNDSVFFNIKYKVISQTPPEYTFNLVGDGGIGIVSKGNKIYSSNEINEHWADIRKVKRYFVLKPTYTDDLKYSYSSQSFLLLLSRENSIAVKKQFNFVFVSFVVKKDLGMLNNEIIW